MPILPAWTTPLTGVSITVVLAQMNDLFAPDIAPLPGSPPLERLFFESPLLLTLIIGVLGVITAAGLLTRRGPKSAAFALLGSVALAAAGFAVANAVETERERLSSLTRQLIRATTEADLPTLSRKIAAEAEVKIPMLMGPNSEFEAQRLLSEGFLDDTYRPLGSIDSHRITELQAYVDGPGSARTQVAVAVTTARAGTRGSWWRLYWYRTGPEAPWEVSRIQAVWIQGFGSGR